MDIDNIFDEAPSPIARATSPNAEIRGFMTSTQKNRNNKSPSIFKKTTFDVQHRIESKLNNIKWLKMKAHFIKFWKFFRYSS